MEAVAVERCSAVFSLGPCDKFADIPVDFPRWLWYWLWLQNEEADKMKNEMTSKKEFQIESAKAQEV